MGLPDTFKALSDPLRRNILILLKNGRMTAGEIARELNISPAALSYHLNLMKKADLVMEYKQKNFIYYELNVTLFDELIIWLKQFGGAKEKEVAQDGKEKNNLMDFDIHSNNNNSSSNSVYE